MKIPPVCDDLTPRTPEALLDPELINAWEEFRVRYPEKEDCLDEIVRVLIESGLVCCSKCKKPKWKKLTGRILKCMKCKKKKRSATAGTFFDHMRAYRAWLAAIWFAERGIIISAAIFQRLLNIAHSSARHIVKRVMIALRAPMQQDQDTLIVSIRAFIEVFRRRSFETSARQSPRTEGESLTNAAVTENDKSVEARERTAEPVTLDRTAIQEYALIEDQLTLLTALVDEPVDSDQLASQTGMPIAQINAYLAMLEMDGLCQRLPGNKFSLGKQLLSDGGTKPECLELSEEELTAAQISKQFMLTRFKGISRKNLQIYLVAHWCSVTMRNRSDHPVLKACLKLGKTTEKEMFLQVTPSVVHVHRPNVSCVART